MMVVKRLLNAYNKGSINITTLLELAGDEGLTVVIKPDGSVKLIKGEGE